MVGGGPEREEEEEKIITTMMIIEKDQVLLSTIRVRNSCKLFFLAFLTNVRAKAAKIAQI